MTAQSLQSPLPTFTGLDGLPLNGGYIYFGTQDQDPEQYPKAVYWDEAMTLVATQPLRTTAGYISRNGAPATVWIDGNCSIRVRDSLNRQVYYQPDWAGFVGAAATAAAAAAVEAVASAVGPLSYSGVVFGWNQDAGLDSARFIAGAKVGPRKIWAPYSPRHVSKNDAEEGMRLDVVEITYSDSAETVTLGTPQTIDTPALFTSGLGASWSCGIHMIQSGPYAGRKIIVAQELNSPDGTYSHIDSRYDLVIWWTDGAVLPATWTRVLVLAGQTAHTSFGLADYNVAATGMHVPSGNCIVEMPDGTLVIGGYLPGPGNGYLVSVHADALTGGLAWTPGTPLLYANAGDNEPTIALTESGVAAFVRNESVNSRSIYESTDGAVWTYSRRATDAPIRNVNACALRTSGGQILVGGPTGYGTTGTDNRTAWKLFPSDNESATFGTGVAMFETNQRIGYSCLIEMGEDSYVHLFEVTSDHGGSFNQKGSLGMLRFNRAALEGLVSGNQPLHDGLRFVAADEYDAYAAYVAADAGTMQDSAAALAAITSAINGNYYSKIGLAVSGRWGHKGLGTASPKLYSLNRTVNSSASLPGGNITLDTGTYAYAVVVFPGGGSKLTFANTVLHGGTSFGIAAKNRAAGGSIGFMWTNTVAHNVNTAGQATFNGATPFITGSPLYGVAATEVAHFHFNMTARVAMAGKDGTDLQSVTYFPKYSTNGQSVSFDLTATGGANQHMAEAWHLNGVGLTTAMVRQCSADVDART